MTAVEIIKVLGTSPDSWEDAAHEAVEEASRSVDNISGMEIQDHTATVEDGSITEYKTTVEVAFPVEDHTSRSRTTHSGTGGAAARQPGTRNRFPPTSSATLRVTSVPDRTAANDGLRTVPLGFDRVAAGGPRRR